MAVKPVILRTQWNAIQEKNLFATKPTNCMQRSNSPEFGDPCGSFARTHFLAVFLTVPP